MVSAIFCSMAKQTVKKIGFCLPFGRELFKPLSICDCSEHESVPSRLYEALTERMKWTCEGLGFADPPFMSVEEYWRCDNDIDMIKGFYYDIKGCPIKLTDIFCVQPDYIDFAAGDIYNGIGNDIEQNLKGLVAVTYIAKQALDGKIPLDRALVIFYTDFLKSERILTVEKYLEGILKEYGGCVKSFGKSPPWVGINSYLCLL